MITARKFSLLACTTWPEPLVEEFVALLGPMRRLPSGTYCLGVDDRDLDMLDPTDQSRLNCPAYARDRQIEPVWIAESIASVDLVRWIIALPLRLNAFDGSAQPRPEFVQNLHVGESMSIWAWIGLATSVGMRLPSEGEWEAAVFGAKTNTARSGCLSTEVKRARALHLSESSHLVCELTSSLGFAEVARELGTDLDAWEPSGSMARWPGVIVRGESATAPNRFSRFSHRYGFAGCSARFAIEEQVLREMDVCPFKKGLIDFDKSSEVGTGSLLREYRI